jgi:hypothetical protein
LNIELQAALNPAGDRKVERFGWTFAPGDKVMQIEKDYDKEVYNVSRRDHPGAAADGSGRAKEGRRHRGAQHIGPAAVVEVGRVAASQRAPTPPTDRRGAAHARAFSVARGGSESLC